MCHGDGPSPTGQTVELLPSQFTTWGAWVEQHPNTLALDAPGRPSGFDLGELYIVVDFTEETSSAAGRRVAGITLGRMPTLRTGMLGPGLVVAAIVFTLAVPVALVTGVRHIASSSIMRAVAIVAIPYMVRLLVVIRHELDSIQHLL